MLFSFLPTIKFFQLNEKMLSGNSANYKVSEFRMYNYEKKVDTNIRYINVSNMFDFVYQPFKVEKISFNKKVDLLKYKVKIRPDAKYTKVFFFSYMYYSQANFSNKLGLLESTNDWTKTKSTIRRNEDGSYMTIKSKKGKVKYIRVNYIGEYQFSKYAFAELNKDISYEEFVKNPNIWPKEQQDKDLITLMQKNKHYLRKYNKFIGKKLNGVYIDWSGLLAASHLVGNYNVRIFLDSRGKIDPCDGNKVKCSTYIKKFNNFDLDLD